MPCGDGRRMEEGKEEGDMRGEEGGREREWRRSDNMSITTSKEKRIRHRKSDGFCRRVERVMQVVDNTGKMDVLCR